MYRGFQVACPCRLSFVLRIRICMCLQFQGTLFMNFQLYRSQFEIMMATGSSYVSVNGGIVTVNNGSSTCPAGSGRRVLVTPLVAGCQQSLQSNRVPPSTGGVLSTRAQTSSSQPQLPSTQVPSPNVLQKVLLKAHGLNTKEKTFSLFRTLICQLSNHVLISKLRSGVG